MKVVAEAVLKTTSISTHIKALTHVQMVAKIKAHVATCAAYHSHVRENLNNKLYALKYLRDSFEAETQGKALSTMAAKHKALVHEALDSLFPERAASHQQGGELYIILSEYLTCIDSIQKDEAAAAEAEAAKTPQIETEKGIKS